MSTATLQTLSYMPNSTAILENAEAFWQAVIERSPQFDGILFYGVRSTGIYCRPTCPSRRPRREHVDFFPDPSSAEHAGLRACLRCRPQEAHLRNPHSELIKRVCDYVEKNLDGTITLKTISAAVGGSPFHLQRTFKQVLGISPMEYAHARRIAVFRTALRFGESVASASYTAGFGSSRGLYELAHEHFGMTPAAYRKGAPGHRVAYTVADSALGKVLVATTDKGVCQIALGDDEEKLSTALFKEFPKALIERDKKKLSTAVKGILDYLNERRSTIDLPLDLQATTFQMRVWHELQKIPFGTTLSYEEVAQRLNQPTATRAVARACATNPVALAVPCHRVVRKNGDLGGYRWGVERKKKLLAQEAEMRGSAKLN